MQPEAIKTIKLNQLGAIIAEKFKNKNMVTCYAGSNAATPTASLEALTEAVKSAKPPLPFIRMVHLLLQGPVPYLEKGLQDRIMTYSVFSTAEVRAAANEGRAFYLPCTLANLESLIGQGRPYEPDLVIIKVCQYSPTGEYSLGLSAEALPIAINQAKLVIAELDQSMPFTQGQSIVDAQSIDYLIVDDKVKPVHILPQLDFNNLSNEEKRIGELITERFLCDGATLQVGIGKIPDAVVATIAKSSYKDLGIQTELYSDGLMYLQKAGIVTNRKKKQNMGYSTTSLIMGSKELYDFVHMRTTVQLRPCTYTNAADIIRKNSPFISINTAMGVDLFGNVWADFIDAHHYYSGVGGQPDFVRALNDPSYGVPIITIPSITHKGESKIAKTHPAGVSQTASSYDGVVVVNEYGAADLRGLTAGEKALALASIAHPRFRDSYLKYIRDDSMFTKPPHFGLEKDPKGVIWYKGSIPVKE